MGPLDLSWLLMNALAPAIVVSALATFVCRALRRRVPARVGWRRQWGLAALAAVAGQALGWGLTGRDGTMTGYALLVGAVALASWGSMSRRRSPA